MYWEVGQVFCDWTIQPDGFSRFLVIDDGFREEQGGRLPAASLRDRDIQNDGISWHCRSLATWAEA
ncbi:hypothetical protein ACU4GD_33075 [Cupriavidus basilensis]